MVTLQSLSGTGSLRVAAEFIGKFLPGTTAYLSNPTWGNHKACRSPALASCVQSPAPPFPACTLGSSAVHRLSRCRAAC